MISQKFESVRQDVLDWANEGSSDCQESHQTTKVAERLIAALSDDEATANDLANIMSAMVQREGGESKIFVERSMSLMKVVMMGLVEMRDQGDLILSVRTIREWMTIEKWVEIMNNESLSGTTREWMRAYLNSMPGFDPNKPASEQSETTIKHFGFAQAYFTRALSFLSDPVPASLVEVK